MLCEAIDAKVWSEILPFVTQTTNSRPSATSLYEIAELPPGFVLPFSAFVLPLLGDLGCCCPLGAAAMRRSPTAADLFLDHNALKQVNSKGEADEEYQNRRSTHYSFVRYRVVEVVALVGALPMPIPPWATATTAASNLTASSLRSEYSPFLLPSYIVRVATSSPPALLAGLHNAASTAAAAAATVRLNPTPYVHLIDIPSGLNGWLSLSLSPRPLLVSLALLAATSGKLHSRNNSPATPEHYDHNQSRGGTAPER
jgi:hypothetical protein